jgi:hypothetical protein
MLITYETVATLYENLQFIRLTVMYVYIMLSHFFNFKFIDSRRVFKSSMILTQFLQVMKQNQHHLTKPTLSTDKETTNTDDKVRI